MRDRFVVGLRNRTLKERLQLTHDWTMTKALEIARQGEQIKQQMRRQNNEVSNTADEARKKFKMGLLQHRSVGLLQVSRNTMRTTPYFKTTVAQAGKSRKS